MAEPPWPLFDLVVRTPRLELRYPDDPTLLGLADVAADGIHPEDYMPFANAWTQPEPPILRRNALQFWWGLRASWSTDDWHLAMAVVVDGVAVGVQGIGSRRFAVTRSVGTGSWVGQAPQGQGIGTEMRAAILHLAFEGLGAVEARSGAFEDNAASLGVSAKLGYESDGTVLHDREGEVATEVRLKLTRDQWADARRDDISIEGLDACRDYFGAPS